MIDWLINEFEEFVIYWVLLLGAGAAIQIGVMGWDGFLEFWMWVAYKVGNV